MASKTIYYTINPISRKIEIECDGQNYSVDEVKVIDHFINRTLKPSITELLKFAIEESQVVEFEQIS